MKIHGFALIAAFAASGCANTQLRYSTARQASSITELQYQQVLNSLAMSVIDPDAIPALLLVKAGTTQVSDLGNGMLTFAAGSRSLLTSPGFNVTRSIVDTWSTIPVTDDTTLKLLRKAFQGALGMDGILSLDEAEDLVHKISAQIGTNADISVDDGTIRALLQSYKPASAQNVDVQLKQNLKDFDESITSTLDEQVLVKDDNPERKNLFLKNKAGVTGLAKETIRQVNDIQKTLTEIPRGWYHVGGKHDVPKDACYVGHSRICGRECYVWVGPEGRADLAKFTLAILRLSTAVKDTQVTSLAGGIQYSPVLSSPR